MKDPKAQFRDFKGAYNEFFRETTRLGRPTPKSFNPGAVCGFASGGGGPSSYPEILHPQDMNP